jgi:hypothetical protein
MPNFLICMVGVLPLLVNETTQASDITPAEARVVAKEAFEFWRLENSGILQGVSRTPMVSFDWITSPPMSVTCLQT